MEWSVRLSAMTLLLLINDEVKGIISGLKCARDSMTKIKVKAGAVCFLLDMENNTNEGNKTGSAFVKKWSSYVEVRTSSPASTVDLQSSDESFNESAIELMNMDFLDQSDAEIGIMKEDDTAAKGKHEKEAQQKYLGLFDVHIDNLVPPTPKRTSRLLDLQHVKFLMDSFQSGFTNQLTILVGMVPERCDTTMLKTKGAVQVETLGGNHTREALQSLIRRGQSKLSTVKVNVYSLLSTATALTVGWQHNVVLQEKQKPITFVDKVRLMRQVRPSNPLTPADMKSWKGLLSSIFQVKDVRRFQQVYGIHLKMAQLDQNIWAMVEDVSESAIKITEKFFRPLVKLSDVEVKTCLEILKRLGLAEYNKKVKEFSPASSKKRKIEDGSTGEMEERNQYEDLLEKYNQMAKDFRASQDRCSVLENENSELKSQLAKQSTQDHKKTGKTTETIEEPIEAFWRFDDGREEWLPAKLIKRYANGDCSVQFSDGFSRIKSSWVRRVGDL